MSQSDKPHPRNAVLKVDPYLPGRAKVDNSQDIHKLSSNESPFGPSPLAIEAYHQASAKIGLYPNSDAAQVREAIARRFNIEADQIICGAGVEDILVLVSRVFLQEGDEAIYTEFGFNMYKIDIIASGATPVVPKEKNYVADVDAILAAVTPRTKVVFLANPNNPTGSYLPVQEIARLHKGLPDDCLFVLDEAYAEYVDGEEPQGIDMARKANNILVTRTFSKVYGLAGLRLGWAYGPADIINAMHRVRYIFNISVAAAAAAVAALNDTAHLEKTVQHTLKWRAWLTKEIQDLGLKVTPSQANFLLVHFPADESCNVKAADAYLMSKGYILRRLEPYGLNNAMRLTVGTEEENRTVVQLLRECMKKNIAA
ncbi:MAG: histidinol-phosphate transaminase [Pseudomonadota bacterium]